MTDRLIVSPRFIGRPAEATLHLSGTGGHMIASAPGTGDETDSLAPIHRELADAVAGAINAGKRPVAIVGDCCQVIPAMAGLARNGIAPGLVWLDSHGDFNTWETTPSGFLGGMPLAMLTGRGDQRLMDQVGLSPIADGRVLLSDARDLDPGERELVKASGIRHMEKVIGVPYVLPEGPVHLHIDTDIIDARLAPAFLYAVPGGPSPEGLAAVIDGILATGQVASVTITAAWNAANDADGTTLAAVRKSVASLLGQ